MHAAALPFPTRQGTQAAIDAMLRALVAAGHDAQLLCYAHGLAHEQDPPYQVHRGSRWSRDRSLRSGPSARKLIADAELASKLDRTRAQAGAGLLIAHHVEAALIAGRAPHVFFAHTDLAAELPSYGPSALRGLLGAAGGALDRALVRRAAAVAAISPVLADRLAAVAGDRAARVGYVPVPWPLPAPIASEERARARAELGLTAGTAVVAYAGNLDAYQGLDALVGAVSQLNGRLGAVALLVATASDPAPLWRQARRAGIAAALRVIELGDELARRQVHAAADVVAVPRRVEGGLPIKLLDALGRGSACVVARSGRAGLSLHGVARVAGGDDASALACEIGALLANPLHGRALRDEGRRFIAREHSAAAFLNAFDRVCRRALEASNARAHAETEPESSSGFAIGG